MKICIHKEWKIIHLGKGNDLVFDYPQAVTSVKKEELSKTEAKKYKLDNLDDILTMNKFLFLAMHLNPDLPDDDSDNYSDEKNSSPMG